MVDVAEEHTPGLTAQDSQAHVTARAFSDSARYKSERLLAALQAEDHLDIAALKTNASALEEKGNNHYLAVQAPTFEALGWLDRQRGDEAHVLKGKDIAARLIPALEKISAGKQDEVPADFIRFLSREIPEALRRLRAARWGQEGMTLTVMQNATEKMTDLQEICLALTRSAPGAPHP